MRIHWPIEDHRLAACQEARFLPKGNWLLQIFGLQTHTQTQLKKNLCIPLDAS